MRTHKPNGPYYPVGLLSGEYCKYCRAPWPCADSQQEGKEETYNGA